MKQLKGSCLCGRVTLEVADDFSFLGYCHCSDCRKWSGSAFGAGGMVAGDALQITGGAESVTRYRHSEATEVAFCRHCGSSLFARKLKWNRYVVRLGILDEAPTRTPDMHIFCASKAPWFEITDSLPRFDRLPG